MVTPVSNPLHFYRWSLPRPCWTFQTCCSTSHLPILVLVCGKDQHTVSSITRKTRSICMKNKFHLEIIFLMTTSKWCFKILCIPSWNFDQSRTKLTSIRHRLGCSSLPYKKHLICCYQLYWLMMPCLLLRKHLPFVPKAGPITSII